MSSKRLSPAAALLRSSRLFSLPPPLPAPSVASVFQGLSTHVSDTATLTHPTHSALSTPASSLSRGDWGLKRPLPLRSTTGTSTPSIRVEEVDSIEHITDFTSAADHTQTLRKWQEMGLPVTLAETRRRSASLLGIGDHSSQRSVFEKDIDRSYHDLHDGTQGRQRWRFKGPWLAGKNPGEFERYITKEIRGRKREFLDFIRQQMVVQKEAERRRIAIEEGTPPLSNDATTEALTVSDEDLQEHVALLRHDTATLSNLIHKFLDLPPSPSPTSTDMNDLFGTGTSARSTNSLYAESGPPKTHPSAGLSYLRSSSHLPNHPILGPQAESAPIEARVLIPRFNASSRSQTPKLGVGGIVTDDRTMPQAVRVIGDTYRNVTRLQPEIIGGGTTWVHPVRANLDADGRINLIVKHARQSTVDLQRGKLPSDDAEQGLPSAPSPVSDIESHSRGGTFRHSYGLEGLGTHKERLEEQPPSGRDRQEMGRTYQELEDLLTQGRRRS